MRVTVLMRQKTGRAESEVVTVFPQRFKEIAKQTARARQQKNKGYSYWTYDVPVTGLINPWAIYKRQQALKKQKIQKWSSRESHPLVRRPISDPGQELDWRDWEWGDK